MTQKKDNPAELYKSRVYVMTPMKMLTLISLSPRFMVSSLLRLPMLVLIVPERPLLARSNFIVEFELSQYTPYHEQWLKYESIHMLNLYHLPPFAES
jgi:hypothetical protein